MAREMAHVGRGHSMICHFCRAQNDEMAQACSNCGRALSQLSPGDVLSSRYEILEILGRGGMGSVHKAHDRILDEMVAVKVLRADLARAPQMARRFRSEIKLARKVSHRNVCRIHEYGEHAGHGYVSMEYIEGVNLWYKVHDEGGLALDEAYEVGIQVSKGLQAIHDVGIIHRDLKTSNIMWDARGLARLIDFGVAKRWMADGEVEGTVVGEIIGTPEYMSPEQARGQRLDFRSDIYALGIVLYEVFTGDVPFRGDTAVATLLKHLEEPPPLEGQAAGRLPRPMVHILAKALAKSRDDRYATARGLTEALRVARSMPDVGPRRTPPPIKKEKIPLTGSPVAWLRPSPPTTPVVENVPAVSEGEEIDTRPVPRVVDEALQSRVSELVDALGHTHVRVRWRAAVALWEIGTAAVEAVPALTLALEDEAASVADAARQALKRITSPDVPPRPAPAGPSTTGPLGISTLIEALGHEDVSVREWAAIAVRDVGPPAAEAVPALMAALEDNMSGIRDWAAMALGSIGPAAKEALPALLVALRDTNTFLRAAAAGAIGAIGTAAESAIPDLINAIKDENRNVRCRAAEALGEMGSLARGALSVLLEALEDRDVSAADAASAALRKIIGGPAAVVVEPAMPPSSSTAGADLVRALKDKDRDVRWRAAIALGETPASSEVVLALVEAIEDPDDTVRWEAVKALGKLGSGAKEAVPALAAALYDEDEIFRHHAASALAAMGPDAEAAVPALIRAFRHTPEGEPVQVVEALIRIGRGAVAALVEALKDENPRIRGKAAETLTRIAAGI
jgi:serine/threonine protein kinase/HEAT repeat protein